MSSIQKQKKPLKGFMYKDGPYEYRTITEKGLENHYVTDVRKGFALISRKRYEKYLTVVTLTSPQQAYKLLEELHARNAYD